MMMRPGSASRGLSSTRYTPEFAQQAHPHAYLSPDDRRVVFNSDRTGLPQSYVARPPLFRIVIVILIDFPLGPRFGVRSG